MVLLLKQSVIVISLSIPQDYTLSTQKQFVDHNTYHEYKSPTLNYNPFQEYEERKNQEILEKLFIDQVKDAR